MTLNFKVEPFAVMWKDAQELIAAHMVELKVMQKLDVNLASFRALEYDGKLVTITAREEGEIKGYILLLLNKHLYYNTKFAQEHSHYLCPSVRKGWNAIKFIRFAQDTIKKFGIDKILWHVEPGHDHGIIFRRLGYKPIYTIYGKE